MYRTHQLLLAIASAGALLLSAPAGAGQASTSFQVTATVGAACTLSASDLAFGTYTGTAVSSQTDILIDCGGTAQVGTLTLSSSTGFAMGPSSGEFLDYDLYRDATHGQQILSGQAFDVPSGVSQVTIFGEIPAGQAAADGNYSDTVSVVFNF